MSETYPIYYNGAPAGTLQAEREGLFTVFTARMEDPGSLVRLSVFGAGGRESCLGVMAPENGALALRKRLSRRDMAGFPEPILYAAPAGTAQPRPAPAAEEEPPEEPPAEPPAEPGPDSRERGTEHIWYQAGDGSLFTARNGHSYRAIPMAAWGLPMEHALEERVIDGVRYAVFALKDGQII